MRYPIASHNIHSQNSLELKPFGSVKKQPAAQGSSDFLSAIVHELKTPLNAIIGFSEILEDEMKNVTTAQECSSYAKEISLASHELLDIIQDLLEVRQANEGNFSVDLTREINIIETISRAIRLNWDYSLKRNISIKYAVNGIEIVSKSKKLGETSQEVAHILPKMKLDAKRMKQIFTNLISNSIKYSPEKTEILVSVKVIDDHQNLEITVSDQGFGMNEEELSQLFSKYKTFENPNSGKVDSFGLGMPIVKELVEMQNGKIDVKSEKGKGTEVRLTFGI